MELVWLLDESSVVSFRACFLRQVSSCSNTGSKDMILTGPLGRTV